MYKRFFLVLFSSSVLLSDTVEHGYESAIPTFAKNPHPGRMSVAMSVSNLNYTNAYIGDEKFPLADKFNSNAIGISAKYHGTNGVGISGLHLMENFSYDSGDDPSRITTALGVYMVWNEIYPESSPSMLDGHQFTFPTTRIVSGLNFMTMKDIDNNNYDAVFFTGALDLIVSKSLILSNFLRFDLSDKDDISWSVLSSKLVYDFNQNISIAPSMTYIQNNNGDYETFVMIEGGYQFKNLSYGYLHTDIKISPFIRLNITGQDVIYPDTELGFNLHFYFN